MASQVTAGRFVGRTQQLVRLHQLLTRAIDGQPLVALLGGEAGVGKTRLVEQLAATATPTPGARRQRPGGAAGALRPGGYMAGNQAEAAELTRQAIALVDAARQPRRAGLLHEQLARCLRRLGDPAALGAHQFPPWRGGCLVPVTAKRHTRSRQIGSAGRVGLRALGSSLPPAHAHEMLTGLGNHPGRTGTTPVGRSKPVDQRPAWRIGVYC